MSGPWLIKAAYFLVGNLCHWGSSQYVGPRIAFYALENMHKQTSCIWYVLMCPFCEPWMWHFCTILKLCVILSYACMKAYKICERACMVQSPVVLPTSTYLRKVHVTTVQTNVRNRQREFHNNYQSVIQETGLRQGGLLNAPTILQRCHGNWLKLDRLLAPIIWPRLSK